MKAQDGDVINLPVRIQNDERNPPRQPVVVDAKGYVICLTYNGIAAQQIVRALNAEPKSKRQAQRVKAVLDCKAPMCGHCIEVLTGNVPADMTLAAFCGQKEPS